MFLSLESPPHVESPAPPVAAPLAPGRVHEAHGSGARAFAARVTGVMAGPVIWIVPEHGDASGRRLNPHGLARFFDPARLILVLAPDAKAMLRAGEEALRSSAVRLVILELPARPALTPGRRLNLAAERGGTVGLTVLPGQPTGPMTAWTVRRVESIAEHPGWREKVLRDRGGPSTPGRGGAHMCASNQSIDLKR